MLRGLLTVYSALAHGAPLEAGPEAATALELFQNWVLVHDDIEDGSEERRGRPALHRLHPMPLALNAGDAMHAEMWGLLAEGLARGFSPGGPLGVPRGGAPHRLRPAPGPPLDPRRDL